MKKKKWNKNIVEELPKMSCIIDPSGFIYTTEKEKIEQCGKKAVLLNFNNPKYGEGWNPLELVYEQYKKDNIGVVIEQLQKMAHLLFMAEKGENVDPFWENISSDFFTGLSLILMKEGNPSNIHLGSVRKLTDDSTNLNQFLPYVNHLPSRNPEVMLVNPTLQAPTETRKSVMAVIRGNLNQHTVNPFLTEMLSKTTFDIHAKDTCYFIIGDTSMKLVNLFLQQLEEIDPTLVVYETTRSETLSTVIYPTKSKMKISYIELPVIDTLTFQTDENKYSRLCMELEQVKTFDAHIFMKFVLEAWDIQDKQYQKIICQKLEDILKVYFTK